jgi:hypothetical protein
VTGALAGPASLALVDTGELGQNLGVMRHEGEQLRLTGNVRSPACADVAGRGNPARTKPMFKWHLGRLGGRSRIEMVYHAWVAWHLLVQGRF